MGRKMALVAARGAVRCTKIICRNLTTSSSSDFGSALRRAHASEVFRSSFYEAKRSDVTVSCLDFDQLIVSERVRPSLLTTLFEISGKGLGLACRLIPSSACSELITESIDDATINHFNDIIRDIKAIENEEVESEENSTSTAGDRRERKRERYESLEDMKETIKYHRNIRSSVSAHSDSSGSVGSDDIFSNLGSPKMVLSSGIYNVLNVTSKL